MKNPLNPDPARRTSRKGFTLLEILVAGGLFALLSVMVGTFLVEVTSIYYASTARSNFSQSAQELAEGLGRDISSTHALYLFPSMLTADRDEDNDKLSLDKGGSFLVLMHVEPRYTTTPAHLAITRLVAYGVDRENPLKNDAGEVVAYNVLRYEVEAPPAPEPGATSKEVWLRNPAVKNFSPASEIEQPARFTQTIDYVAEVLKDPNPRVVVTIDANSDFSIDHAFILRANGVVTMAFGVIHSSGLQQTASKFGGHDIVSNTFNYSFQRQG
ncbi:MAG: prepilin-type N-terminal cleavage/methylation domain-containing protein [Verrucomicrobiota bacterium JB022]|nr:prepilin-type N-terminal cleavage/methylation domain-containing protein [Verrucomicrobiota bacterium JB022]